MATPKKKIVWFARGGHIARTGPFATQVEATNSLRLAKREGVVYDRQEFPPDAFVWPEEVDG